MMAGSVTFSRALKAGSRWWNWNTKPMLRPRSAVISASERLAVSRPAMLSRPPVGRSRRPMMLSRVLLPEPDGPISAANSPCARLRSRPWSTSVSTGVPTL